MTCPLLFFFKIIYLLTFGDTGSSLLCAGFLWLQSAEATLPCSVWASHGSDFSRFSSWTLGCVGFSSCGSSFLVSRLFTLGDSSIGASVSAPVLPMNIQDWFPLGLTGLISSQSKGLSSLLQHHSSKASILQCSAFFMVQLSHPLMITGKTIALIRRTFVGKVMSLLFNILSRFVIASLLRSKHFLISWLQSPSAVILEPKKIKSVTVSIVSPSIFSMKGWDQMPWS